jgi:pentatricopeptide repeat domain-containing protein 1
MLRSEVEMDVISFSAAISACEKGGEWEKALQLMRVMVQNKHKLDTITLNAAISACEKSGQWETALGLLESMPGLGIAPNVITISATISACGKGGQWEKALYLFESMPEHSLEPDAIAVRSTVEALDAADQFDRAAHIMEEGRSRGLFDDVWVSDSTVDLHQCSAAWARSLLRCLLRDLRTSKRKVCDIVVITGRGNRSVGSPVLPQETRSFLTSVEGPIPTDVPGNPGQFVLKKKSILAWAENVSPL